MTRITIDAPEGDGRSSMGYAPEKFVGLGGQVTLVMPTRYRLNFVRAYIKFLAIYCFSGHLIVADGSDEGSEIELNECFDEIAPRFRLTVVHEPKLCGDSAWKNINRCISQASKYVDTRYVSLCFDDDFVLPHFLSKATSILDTDENLGFVVGRQLALELPDRDRIVPWWLRAHLLGNERRISANDAISRIDNFFSAPFQLAYAVVRSSTFMQYVSLDHEKYFVAQLSSDYSWYCTILASGCGALVRDCEVLRLAHDMNTQTYGQRTTEISNALKDGRVAADLNRFSKRIWELTSDRKGLCGSSSDPRNMVDAVTVSITLGLLAKLCGANSKSRQLSWPLSAFFRLSSKILSLIAGIRSYHAICKLDRCLRAHGL